MNRSRYALSAMLLTAWMLALVPIASSAEQDETPTGDPGDPIQLNPEFTDPAQDVWLFQISPDGTRIVYLVIGDGWEYALYSVPIGGGASTRLTPPMDDEEYIEGNFRVSLDSTRVLYVSNHETLGNQELFSVPIDGGVPVRLSAPLPSGAWLENFVLAPDGNTVVYWADVTTFRDMVAFAAPLTTGPVVRLYPPDPDAEYLAWVRVTPDSETVVLSTGDGELIAVPIDGGEPTTLASGLGFAGNYTISNDGGHVVFINDVFDDTLSLRSSPIAGGPSVKLGDGVTRYEVAADSSRVVWLEDNELFSSSIEGGAASPLGSADTFAIAPDSGSVWFGSHEAPREIYRIPIDGGYATSVGVPIDPWNFMYPRGFTADSQRLVFDFDGEVIASVPRSGGGATPLTLALPWFGGLGEAMLSPDAERLVYTADQYTDNENELFSVPTRGGSVVRLNGELTQFGSVKDIAITPDSRRVVYTADQEVNEQFNLYIVLIGWECGGRFATIVGTTESDTLVGTDGDDVIAGLAGEDLLRGRGGADVICGGPGADLVKGGRGGDIIFGNGGADELFGGTGGDFLSGGKGADTIHGNNGHDELRGQAGHDELWGGRKTDNCFGGSGTDSATACETVAGIP